jgi:hypothetical protein
MSAIDNGLDVDGPKKRVMLGAMSLLLSALLVPAIALSAPPSAPADPCGAGARTHVELDATDVPAIRRHDESIGRVRVRLLDAAGKTLLDERLEGEWRCLGFETEHRRYVLGGVSQIGAWLPLRSIVYVDAAKPRLAPSAFDRGEYLAFVAVPSPSGRFVALIGGKGVADGLYVLDVARDTIKKLGPAPAPPPAEGAAAMGEAFTWGDGWADGFLTLDPGIVVFAGDALRVSYGKDSAAGRAKVRKTRTFPLSR